LHRNAPARRIEYNTSNVSIISYDRNQQGLRCYIEPSILCSYFVDDMSQKWIPWITASASGALNVWSLFLVGDVVYLPLRQPHDDKYEVLTVQMAATEKHENKNEEREMGVNPDNIQQMPPASTTLCSPTKRRPFQPLTTNGDDGRHRKWLRTSPDIWTWTSLGASDSWKCWYRCHVFAEIPVRYLFRPTKCEPQPLQYFQDALKTSYSTQIEERYGNHWFYRFNHPHDFHIGYDSFYWSNHDQRSVVPVPIGRDNITCEDCRGVVPCMDFNVDI